MSSFFDDFERADGAPGNGWVPNISGVVIAGGALTGSSWWAASNTTVGDVLRCEASATFENVAGPSERSCIAVKMDFGAGGGYYARVLNLGGPYTLQICMGDPSSATVLASAVCSGAPGGTFYLSIVWDGGLITATAYDGTTATASDSTLAANPYAGVLGYATYTRVLSFESLGGALASMSVTPNPVWIGGGPVQLTATATGTTWTLGVPGSSTLTCDHGSIVGQYTIDSTHINFTYLTDLWLGAVVFTESEHGMTASIDVTLTPPATQPWGLTLSPTAIAYIERSAVAEAAPTIANREMVVGGGGVPLSMLDGLADLRSSVDDPTYSPSGTPGANRTAWLIWRILNGVNSPPRMPLIAPSDTTLKEDADAIQASLSALITSNHWTLGDVITQITGSGVPTIKDVLDAIADLPGSDLSDVTTRLDAMRGDTTTSLYTLLGSLAGIRTTSAYSLGDVRSWIGTPAQAKPDATAFAVGALLLALLAAPETGGASLAVLAAAEGAGPVLDVATLVELVSVAGEIAGVVADIAELKAKPVSGYTGAPVWPGLSNVALGSPLTLVNGLVVTGPLDGLLFTITEQPEHNQRYLFGSTNSWSRVGAVIFETDNGYWERSQSVALDKHIIVPQTMARAASAAIRMNANWHGTVRSWVTSP